MALLKVSGLTYSVVTDAPAFGMELDEAGFPRPVAIWKWQVMIQAFLET